MASFRTFVKLPRRISHYDSLFCFRREIADIFFNTYQSWLYSSEIPRTLNVPIENFMLANQTDSRHLLRHFISTREKNDVRYERFRQVIQLQCSGIAALKF